MTSDFPHKKMRSLSKGLEEYIGKRFLSIDVDIILGQPTRHCSHLGICKIEPEEKGFDPMDKSPSSRVKASIFWYSKEEVILLFKKTSITLATREFHFEKKYFTILETVSLPGFVRDVFKEDFLLLPGEYLLHETKLHFIVRFGPRTFS